MKTEFFKWLFIKSMSSQQFYHLLVVTFMFLGSPEYFSLTQISLVNCLNLGRKFTTHQKKNPKKTKRKFNIKKTMKLKEKKVVIKDADIYVTSSSCDCGTKIYHLNARENKHKVWSLFKTTKFILKQK